MRLVLEAIVQYALEKGLPAAVAKLRASKLGAAFAKWVESMFPRLKAWSEARKSRGAGGNNKDGDGQGTTKKEPEQTKEQDANEPHADANRQDYSRGFEDDLENFKPGYELHEGRLKEDLTLVQYHSDAPLGSGRSAKWWTTAEEAKRFKSVDDVREALALPPDWGVSAILCERLFERTVQRATTHNTFSLAALLYGCSEGAVDVPSRNPLTQNSRHPPGLG